MVEAGKWIENRSWEPPQALLGQTFAIHAGLKKPTADLVTAALECATEAGSPIEAPAEFERGCIVGVATLHGYISLREDGEWMDAQLANGERRATIAAAKEAVSSACFFGPTGFLLKDVSPLREPIPCKGAFGFWELSAELERAIRRQFRGRPSVAGSLTPTRRLRTVVSGRAVECDAVGEAG